jgi:hypothetical protein
VSTAREELGWLYKHAIHTDYAIISVGTNNAYGHPREEVVDALRGGWPKSIEKSVVICTQITKNCCNDQALEKIRPGVLAPLFPSLIDAGSSAGERRNRGGIACAGTIVSEISEDVITIRRIRDHQQKVDDLQELVGARPMCRKRLSQVPSPSTAGK